MSTRKVPQLYRAQYWGWAMPVPSGTALYFLDTYAQSIELASKFMASAEADTQLNLMLMILRLY